MMDVMHYLLASDRYALHFALEAGKWTTSADVQFVCVDPGCMTVRCAGEKRLGKKKDGEVLFSGRKCEMSLLKDKGLRFVGHMDDFVHGDALLVDVHLKSFGMEMGVRRFEISGTMVVGDETFVFAPAHSAALIWKETEEEENRLLAAWVYEKTPCALVFEEEYGNITPSFAPIKIPFSPKHIEALQDEKQNKTSFALIHGVMKERNTDHERPIHPLIAVRT